MALHEDVLGGAAGGALATLPMSLVMVAAQKLGLMGRQPPKKIVRRGYHLLGRRAPQRDAGVNAATSGAHIGFGTATGIPYALFARAVPRRVPPVLTGAAYGLLVWAVSYRGWVPRLAIMPRPDHDRRGRPTSMIAAHLVYGGALGAFVGRR